MLQKNGSYFADWRDTTGKRHRKAFPTLSQAVEYSEQMRAANPQPDPPHPSRQPSRKPRRRTSARRPTTRTRKQHSRH